MPPSHQHCVHSLTRSTGHLPVELNMKTVPQDMYKYSASPPPPLPPRSEEMFEDLTKSSNLPPSRPPKL